ncbi:MAG: hypothetical protein WC481_08880 [Candidatus Omnitrophota bacterium]
MKLWLLRPKEGLPENEGPLNPWEPWYDKTFGFVIRAETEGEARKIAKGDCDCEGRSAWSSAFSTCIELLPEGESGIIIKDFARA